MASENEPISACVNPLLHLSHTWRVASYGIASLSNTTKPYQYDLVNRITQKNIFRCLHKCGGPLQLKLDTVTKVIVACCVLHNMMRVRHPTDIVEIIPDDELEDLDVFGEDIVGVDKRGNQVRRDLIDRIFQH